MSVRFVPVAGGNELVALASCFSATALQAYVGSCMCNLVLCSYSVISFSFSLFHCHAKQCECNKRVADAAQSVFVFVVDGRRCHRRRVYTSTKLTFLTDASMYISSFVYRTVVSSTATTQRGAAPTSLTLDGSVRALLGLSLVPDTLANAAQGFEAVAALCESRLTQTR